jgi:hypothetical protein
MNNNIKLYTFYSKSHEVFIPWFKNSIKDVEPDISIVFKEVEQKCRSGEFASLGWNDFMSEKIKYIIEIINTTKDDYFIFSDIDVQFFQPVTNQTPAILKNCDIALQNDYGSVCTGLFYCRVNEKTKSLFTEALKRIIYFRDDQDCIDYILNQNVIKELTYEFLPDEYFTYGKYASQYGGTWNVDDIDFEIPENMITHHANYTVGIENKINLLQLVREKYQSKNED